MTAARVRIRSVRPRGSDGPRLLMFPDNRERDRRQALKTCCDTVDGHIDAGGSIVGVAVVVWDRDGSSSVSVCHDRRDPLPKIAIGGFFRSRVEAAVVCDWLSDD